MAVDQLPGRLREFVAYLDGLLARLDQGAGWCAVFWQRDPDGMQACRDGREVPPWDVVESLLQDLAAEYGPEVAHAEAERARPLHAAAQTAHDARPGGRDALGDRFDVMLREQRYAAERQAELGRRLGTATTQEEADAIRLDLAWARDDHERAVRRCAELQSRMAELDGRSMGGRGRAIRRGQVTDGGVFRGAYGDGGDASGDSGHVADGTGGSRLADGYGGEAAGAGGHVAGDTGGGGRGLGGYGGDVAEGGGHVAGDSRVRGREARHHGDAALGFGGHESGVRGADGRGAEFPNMPQQRDTTSTTGTEATHGGSAEQWPGSAEASRPGYSPQWSDSVEAARAGRTSQWSGSAEATHDGPAEQWPGSAEAARPGYSPHSAAPADTTRPGPHRHSQAGAPHAAYAPYQQASPAATRPGTEAPQQPTPAAQPPEAPAPTNKRKRRRGSARFAGMAEEGGAPVVVPPAAVPDLPTGPVTKGRTPRGARFAGAAEAPEERSEQRAEPSDVVARRETADTIATLTRLRAEGRTGEAHALLAEVAHWPADRFPLLAAELRRAGLRADWATLLWEAASLPADRLVAAADALVAAGRSADGEQVLRQGVARPAGEIGAAVLGLVAEGRRREVSALLDAYVRVRTPEEAARSAEPGPQTLVPLLLAAARGVSDERHWDLVHALRVAGFSA
ncbi:hypothetical protein [Streptomyces canus]|uniref:hypothetical protein n=1 Tax=Streptomyces canus TaxID=58343 RepID=UPI00225B700A|nr:hypothetical protein [Streptomyces canus]MCX4855720.1 hypothetical protein [Streptomyces canus]